MSWLTAEQLELAVARCADNEAVRQAFIGVYPHNRLPPPLQPPPSVAATTSNNKESRHHYCSARFQKPTTAAAAAIELPPFPLAMIVNTDTHNLPGRHWTSVYIDCYGHGELFDSLVTPPSAHLTRFMNRHCRRWQRNQLIYQHPLSSHCGVYVLLHVLNRYKYTSLKQFCTSVFTPSLLSNECLVQAYYKQYLHSLIAPTRPGNH